MKNILLISIIVATGLHAMASDYSVLFNGILMPATAAYAEQLAVQAIHEFDQLKDILVNNETSSNDINYAQSLLEHYSPISSEYPEVYGQLNHYAELIIADAYLKNNAIDQAAAHLTNSCKQKGFTLKSFGPNMQVANRMLEKSLSNSVVDYLKACQKHWLDRKAYLWEEMIKEGKTPDFGANLNY